METTISPGRYRHYKGKEYELVGLARHSETLEEMVIYKALYDDKEFGRGALWARPKALFADTVEVEGKSVQRFEKVK